MRTKMAGYQYSYEENTIHAMWGLSQGLSLTRMKGRGQKNALVLQVIQEEFSPARFVNQHHRSHCEATENLK